LILSDIDCEFPSDFIQKYVDQFQNLEKNVIAGRVQPFHSNENLLERYLRNNDIFDSDKHQTTIRISCGKFGVDLKVSYREFYNKFELCKLALQNYKYEIEVI